MVARNEPLPVVETGAAASLKPLRNSWNRRLPWSPNTRTVEPIAKTDTATIVNRFIPDLRLLMDRRASGDGCGPPPDRDGMARRIRPGGCEELAGFGKRRARRLALESAEDSMESIEVSSRRESRYDLRNPVTPPAGVASW